MAREKINWRTFDDEDSAIAHQWNFSGTPSYYIIDHEGTIRHHWVGAPGAETIDKALEKLIHEAEKAGAPK